MSTAEGWEDGQKAVMGQVIVLRDRSNALILREHLASAEGEEGFEIDFSISGITLLAEVSTDEHRKVVSFNAKALLELMASEAIALAKADGA